ncbi:hypothetical protein C7M84_019901 [Penaeus vannamei]|uniref:Uncharacterized protein n=1 Tax=Penaeus vannamei TaxID=6689 RepID=A0A423SDI4_PENVA|nr:hypothetical protein C7M84_019901 [Penaeus vannamei]
MSAPLPVPSALQQGDARGRESEREWKWHPKNNTEGRSREFGAWLQPGILLNEHCPSCLLIETQVVRPFLPPSTPHSLPLLSSLLLFLSPLPPIFSSLSLLSLFSPLPSPSLSPSSLPPSPPLPILLPPFSSSHSPSSFLSPSLSLFAPLPSPLLSSPSPPLLFSLPLSPSPCSSSFLSLSSLFGPPPSPLLSLLSPFSPLPSLFSLLPPPSLFLLPTPSLFPFPHLPSPPSLHFSPPPTTHPTHAHIYVFGLDLNHFFRLINFSTKSAGHLILLCPFPPLPLPPSPTSLFLFPSSPLVCLSLDYSYPCSLASPSPPSPTSLFLFPSSPPCVSLSPSYCFLLFLLPPPPPLPQHLSSSFHPLPPVSLYLLLTASFLFLLPPPSPSSPISLLFPSSPHPHPVSLSPSYCFLLFLLPPHPPPSPISLFLFPSSPHPPPCLSISFLLLPSVSLVSFLFPLFASLSFVILLCLLLLPSPYPVISFPYYSPSSTFRLPLLLLSNPPPPPCLLLTLIPPPFSFPPPFPSLPFSCLLTFLSLSLFAFSFSSPCLLFFDTFLS